MKMSVTMLSIVLITFILGTMLALQFRTTRYIEQGIPMDRAQELQVELSKIIKDNRKLDNEIEDLGYKLEQAQKGHLQAQEALHDELIKSKISAGLVPVLGSGIEVILDNPPAQTRKGSISIIRDGDLLRVVNELKGAGAEAISINGQRLISISEIRQAGAFININLERIEAPFIILAIGNPEKLKSSLDISGGLVDYFGDLGIVVKMKTSEKVVIPRYQGTLQYKYATTSREG